MPDTKDSLTLLAKYHEEWTVYRDQLMYLPGPFRPLEEDFLNRSDIVASEISGTFFFKIHFLLTFDSEEVEINRQRQHNPCIRLSYQNFDTGSVRPRDRKLGYF